MNCKIHRSCPHARNCSIVKEAEFCAYHQQYAPEVMLDFIPIEEAPVIYKHDSINSEEFDKLMLRANLRNSKRV